MKYNNILIVCTLEDCLLNNQGEINEISLKNLDFFIKVGGKFTITSRMSPFQLDNLKLEKIFDLNIPIIAFNGAITYEYGTISRLKSKNTTFCNYTPFDKFVCSEMTSKILKNFDDCGIEVYTQDDVYLLNYNKISEKNFIKMNKNILVMKMEYMKTFKNWFRITFTHENKARLMDIKLYIEKEFGTVARSYFFDDNNLDVQCIDSSKATAVLKLAGKLNVSPDYIHPIGVSEEDIKLVKLFEKSFCVGNAKTCVRNASNTILHDNDKPLMYYVIEHLDKYY